MSYADAKRARTITQTHTHRERERESERETHTHQKAPIRNKGVQTARGTTTHLRTDLSASPKHTCPVPILCPRKFISQWTSKHTHTHTHTHTKSPNPENTRVQCHIHRPSTKYRQVDSKRHSTIAQRGRDFRFQCGRGRLLPNYYKVDRN